jgi:hypothetical protein
MFNKEDKNDLLLKVAMVLGTVSIFLILFSAIAYYTKQKSISQSNPNNNVLQTTEIIDPVRDSLQKAYSTTETEIDTKLLVDTTLSNDKDAQTKLTEMSALRAEITDLLNAKSPNADLTLAKIKIEELQIKVTLLQNKYSGMEAENKRLQAILNDLLASEKPRTASQQILPTNTQKDNFSKNKIVGQEKATNTASSSSVIGLQMITVMMDNNKEVETSDSEEAEKIQASFSFKNGQNKNTSNEVMVIVLQPDGRVIKNSGWDAGIFETKEGRKVYSRKMILDAGVEEKKFNFSLTPETFLKGNYTIQIWHNGILIAKSSKYLS